MKNAVVRAVVMVMACLVILASVSNGRVADMESEGLVQVDEESLKNAVEFATTQQERSLLSGNLVDSDEQETLKRKLFFKKIGKGIKKVAKKAGSGIKKVAKKTGSGIKKAAEKTGSGIKKAAEKTASGIKTAVNKVKKVVVAGFDYFCEVLDDIEDFVKGLDIKLKRAQIEYKKRYAEYQELKSELQRLERSSRRPSRAWFGKLKRTEDELDKVEAEIRSIKREMDAESEICEAIRDFANDVEQGIKKAIEEVKEFVEEHKCFLIETGFAIAGEIGDAALGVLSAGTLEAQEANPICQSLAQGKFTKSFDYITEAVDRGQTASAAATEFSGKGAAATDIITGVPNVATPADLVVLLFEQAQQTACILRNDFGLRYDIIDAACTRGDVATSFITVLLNAYCGDFGSAVAEILSIAAECAAGCSNGFCPNDHRLLLAKSSGLRGHN